MSETLNGTILLPGAAAGRLLVLSRPISFWGGVDPASGRIADPRHPQHEASIAGRLLALPGTIGSSSSSSVLLELIVAGHAPTGLILVETDAILLLGGIVARELGHRAPPALKLAPADFARLPDGAEARLDEAGGLHLP